MFEAPEKHSLGRLRAVKQLITVALDLEEVRELKLRFKININYDVQTTSHNFFRSLKKNPRYKTCCRCNMIPNAFPGAANDPRPQMIPRPETNGMDFGFLDFF